MADRNILRDVGKPHRFSSHYPGPTNRWPGRELYFAWRHPIIILVIVFCAVNVVLGILGYPLVVV